jgi:hypothetical protein
MKNLDKTDLVYLVGGIAIVYLLFFKKKGANVSVTAEPIAGAPTTNTGESANPYDKMSDASLFSSSMLPRMMPVIPSTGSLAGLTQGRTTTSTPSTQAVSKTTTPVKTATA